MKAKRAINKKWLVAIGAFVVLGVVGGIVAMQFRSPTLPPVDASNKDLVKFCSTDQFAKLPLEQQEPYVRHLMDQGFIAILIAANDANMTPAERQKGLENAMQAGIAVRWGKHLDEWMKLDGKAKAQYVKNVAASMPPRPPGFDPRGASRNNRFMTADQQKRFIESMSPDRRAAMPEFMSQLEAAKGDGGQ